MCLLILTGPVVAAEKSAKPLDVVVASHEGVQVWFGQGNARFQASDQGFLSLPSTTSVALGDLDGDGDLDLFVTSYEQKPSHVFLNDGTGHFRDSGQALPPADHWRVALGDLDGDGDLDAFLVGATGSYTSPKGQPNEVWLNDGKGRFADSGQRLGKTGGSDAVLTDLDDDSDLDAIVVEPGGTGLWINQGEAILRDRGGRIGRAEAKSQGIALGDLDGDGDQDVFLANPGPNEVWLNQGRGQFTLGHVLEGSFDTFAVALGDLDGDGDLDAYLANRPAPQPNRVLFNNGKGNFKDSGQLLHSGVTLHVALADFDGDGDLDAIEANRASPNLLWLNDGKGRFKASGQNLGNWKSRKIAVGTLR